MAKREKRLSRYTKKSNKPDKVTGKYKLNNKRSKYSADEIIFRNIIKKIDDKKKIWTSKDNNEERHTKASCNINTPRIKNVTKTDISNKRGKINKRSAFYGAVKRIHLDSQIISLADKLTKDHKPPLVLRKQNDEEYLEE